MNPLTKKQTETLLQLASGKGVKRAALALKLAKLTVDSHAKEIRARLGVTTITGAVVEALKLGIISLEQIEVEKRSGTEEFHGQPAPLWHIGKGIYEVQLKDKPPRSGS